MAYVLVFFYVCKDEANDIKETTEAWQKINKTLYPVLDNANGTGCTRVKTLEERVSELERKVEALNNMLSEAGIGTWTNSD